MRPPNTSSLHITRYIRNTLIGFLYFPVFSLAAPLKDSSMASGWLACLTALLVLSVVCLSVFKLLFVRHRRTSDLKGPAPTLVRGKHAHRNLKLPRFSVHMTCTGGETCRAGFLIGLFGSPSFEIRSKPSEIRLIYSGANNSKSSRKQDLSGDTSTTCNTKVLDFSTGPIVLFDEKTTWHTCAKQTQTRFDSSTRRNSKSLFFLPTQLPFDLGQIGRKKKKVQPPISTQESSLPWPHNHLEHATLRLVKVYTDPDTPLPLYGGFNSVPGYSTSGPAVPPHSLAVAYLNRSQPTSIQSLPPLPVVRKDQKQELDILPVDMNFDHTHNHAPLSLVKPGRQNSRRASLSPNLSVINEACYSLPDIPRVPNVEHVLANVGELNPVKTLPLAYNACDTLRRREREGMRSSPFRNRRSPPLGPSPLRSMILPDSADDDVLESKSPVDNGMDNTPTPKRLSMPYQHLGLELPTFGLAVPADQRLRSQGPNASISEGQESVLDFLRELVEETKDWDESIVLDEGFRNMIQGSQVTFSRSSLGNANVKKSAPHASSPDQTPRFVSFWIEDSPSP